MLGSKRRKINKLEKENTELKEKLEKKNKKKEKNGPGFWTSIGNSLKSKKRKESEAEVEKLRLENEKLKENKKTKLGEGIQNIEDKSNEITGDIWTKISEMSVKMNSSIFNGANVANDTGNKIIENLKDKIGELSDQATDMKLEEILSNNFNESLFVKAILEGKINFTFKGERNIYDFMTVTGTKYIWKSDYEYFEFTLLRKVDKTAEFIFKINHIDVKVTMIHVNYNRLYNAIINKKDETQLILTK